jgi:hypothetical protein
MRFVDLEPGDPRLTADVLPVLLELRPHLTPESFAHVYSEGHPQGLRCTAVYDNDRCVAVAGWRLVATTVALRKLYVDDLVTASDHRGQGVARHFCASLRVALGRQTAVYWTSTAARTGRTLTVSTSAREW